jgi:hypothetical protein
MHTRRGYVLISRPLPTHSTHQYLEENVLEVGIVPQGLGARAVVVLRALHFVHDRHVVRPRDGPLDVRPLAQSLDVRAARRGEACNVAQLGAAFGHLQHGAVKA